MSHVVRSQHGYQASQGPTYQDPSMDSADLDALMHSKAGQRSGARSIISPPRAQRSEASSVYSSPDASRDMYGSAQHQQQVPHSNMAYDGNSRLASQTVARQRPTPPDLRREVDTARSDSFSADWQQEVRPQQRRVDTRGQQGLYEDAQQYGHQGKATHISNAPHSNSQHQRWDDSYGLESDAGLAVERDRHANPGTYAQYQQQQQQLYGASKPHQYHGVSHPNGGDYSSDYDDMWDGEIDHSGSASASPRSGIVASKAAKRPHSAKQHRAGQRPVLTTQDRLALRVSEALKRSVATWDVSDVCNWIELLGFEQYRKKIVHNSVDGQVLLKLTDEQMLRDLKILPLGHRQALLAKIQELKEHKPVTFDSRAGSPAKGPRGPAAASSSLLPPDSFLGPAQGKITVTEQKQKLEYHLNRTISRAAQAGTLIEQLAHNKSLEDAEAARLRGQLQAINARHAKLQQKAAPTTKTSLDPNHVAVPWIPNNYEIKENHPERFAGPGDDPKLDLTFCTKKTPAKLVPSEVRATVEEGYRRPGVIQQATRDLERITKLKEELADLEKEAENADRMASVQHEAEEMAANPAAARKAAQLRGYWLPGGIMHKMPQQKGALDREADMLSQDIKYLERKLKEWGYPEQVPRSKPDNPRAPRLPYDQLLRVLDDVIDAIVTPQGNQGDVSRDMAAFQNNVRRFFKDRRLDIHVPEAKDGGSSLEGIYRDCLLSKVYKMKGCEKLSEMDKKKLQLKYPNGCMPGSRKDDTARVEDVVEGERRRHKIRVLAGLAHMAEFIARTFGMRAAGDNSDDDDDTGDFDNDDNGDQDTGRRKSKNVRRGTSPYGRSTWTAHGPFLPNGILERPVTSAKSWGMLSNRITSYRKKVGLGSVTMEERADQRGSKAKEEAANKDLAKAEELFHMLGWHHVGQGDASHLKGMTVTDLINNLLKRALYAANQRQSQLLMMKDAKRERAELLKELRLKVSRLAPADPGVKQLDSRIQELKALDIAMPDIPAIDWKNCCNGQFAEDGLSVLQECELSLQRPHVERQWDRQMRRAQRAGVKKQHVRKLADLTRVEWDGMDQAMEHRNEDIEKEVAKLNFLESCVSMLGGLPPADITCLLRMPPAGLPTTQNDGRQDNERHHLQMYDDTQKKGKSRNQEDVERKQAAARAKELKAKKIALYRAIASQQFVGGHDEYMQQREKRMQELTTEQIRSVRPGSARKVTEETQEAFFGRLLQDIHARNQAAEKLRAKHLQMERDKYQPFRARPYSPGPEPEVRSRSPRPTSRPASASLRHDSRQQTTVQQPQSQPANQATTKTGKQGNVQHKQVADASSKGVGNMQKTAGGDSQTKTADLAGNASKQQVQTATHKTPVTRPVSARPGQAKGPSSPHSQPRPQSAVQPTGGHVDSDAGHKLTLAEKAVALVEAREARKALQIPDRPDWGARVGSPHGNKSEHDNSAHSSPRRTQRRPDSRLPSPRGESSHHIDDGRSSPRPTVQRRHKAGLLASDSETSRSPSPAARGMHALILPRTTSSPRSGSPAGYSPSPARSMTGGSSVMPAGQSDWQGHASGQASPMGTPGTPLSGSMPGTPVSQAGSASGFGGYSGYYAQ